MAECANDGTGREHMRSIEWDLDLVHGTMVNTNGGLCSLERRVQFPKRETLC
ncbi:hypothetical protein TIFTF001_044224 [Ficus carica]|uniref:Uncharacterized protein n=1 Tax=Ficus carica TaxID=3494 RepID=A0AA88CSD7_FICCA|nr:hypothetical protein TIFTF001_044224 [Ficus carica]